MVWRGFSTLEIVLALTIMTTTLSAIVLLELGGPSALANGALEVAAARAGADLLEAAFAQGLTDFTDIDSVASSTTDGMTTSLTVTLLPDGLTKSLVSMVAWTDVEGISRFVALHAFVTDFKDVTPDLCSNVLTGNWTQPRVSSYTVANGDLVSDGTASAYPISSLAADDSMLLAGIGTTTTRSDPTLLLFDISSATEPRYLGSIDNASSTKQGVNAIAVAGSYAYVANASRSNFATCKAGPACAQMQVFDMSNPEVPVDVQDFQLATTSPPFATGNAGQAIGKSITYADERIYLGLAKSGSTSGDEFNIIDVHQPGAPEWIGGFSIGRSINKIVVKGSYAYLATDDPTRELIVLDIHDPAHITLVGSYDAPGISTFGYGNDLALENTTLALGRTYTPNGPGLSLLSVASTAPQFLVSEPIFSSADPVNVQALLMRGFLLFVLTNSSLETFDITDPAFPLQYAAAVPMPAGSIASAMTCRGNTLYISSIGSNQTGYLTTVTGS